MVRIFSSVYSLILLLFYFQAKPLRKFYYAVYLVFSMMISLDIMLSLMFLEHLIFPAEKFLTFGLVFYFIYPMLPIVSPVLGIIGVNRICLILQTLFGSPRIIKNYMNINALLCLFNYPTTMIAQIVFQDSVFYILLVFLMLLIKVRSSFLIFKIILSFLGGKIIADLENPHFYKNEQKLKQISKNKIFRLSQSGDDNN